MRPTKRTERRRGDRLALIERRRGGLWTYGQVPVCSLNRVLHPASVLANMT